MPIKNPSQQDYYRGSSNSVHGLFKNITILLETVLSESMYILEFPEKLVTSLMNSPNSLCMIFRILLTL